LTLWLLGYPDQALKEGQKALILAQEFSHPYSLAFALSMVPQLHWFRRERQAAQEWAEATISLCTEHGFVLLLALGTLLRGWALTTQGQEEEGITQIHQGLAAAQVTGAELGRPQRLVLLAEVYAKVGQIEEGLTLLTEALALVDKTGERWCEAELYRLRGELTLQEANQKSKGKSQKSKVETNPQREVVQEAEGYFLKAVEIARKQQAKSWELRATTSLARLWQQQDKEAEAHRLLSEIYSWFTEGLDTKDLQEAKVLLAELEK
jgi:predicted ATPase